MRPYHPADQEQAVALIQRTHALTDSQSAHATLRRWRRRIDCDVRSYQVHGELVGLFAVPTDTDDHDIIEIAALDEFRAEMARG
jgi:hypothetical protein